MFLNVGVVLDFKIVEEYKIYIICIGMLLMELFLIVRILDKFVIILYIVLGMIFNNKLSFKYSLFGREKKI